jgi:hypothetical protein
MTELSNDPIKMRAVQTRMRKDQVHVTYHKLVMRNFMNLLELNEDFLNKHLEKANQKS